MSERSETGKSERSTRVLIEGEDFYLENALMVLTEKCLRDRGVCCGNLCRHCPYPKAIQAEAALKKKFV